ncbi:hypothetical protein BC938DRAFT_475337 [Jimgerdemannia flammicorona]|uniref:Uncharacterized protein n=1 Tax=Jimgerdemannia flammicorona TaxID=994334 RepID=A0A433QRQ6_9FUNG|nr:hypothetical protein BC938DRAFT_475337 [Jimgerdemannia flammicorona]
MEQLEHGIQTKDEGFKKFQCFYVNFQHVVVDSGAYEFWSSFGKAFPKRNSASLDNRCEHFPRPFQKGARPVR